MTKLGGRKPTDLVPQLYTLIDNPGPNATPEQNCLFNLTKKFYKRIQKVLEQDVLSEWMTSRDSTTKVEVDRLRAEFWDDVFPRVYKEGVLEATQKFKDMLNEIGAEEMRKTLGNLDGLALERLFGMMKVED